MAEEINTQKAQEVFNTLLNFMDAHGRPYVKKGDFHIMCNVSLGGPSSIGSIIVEPSSELVFITVDIPFIVPDEKRSDIALAICHANCNIFGEGFFDFDLLTGSIVFKSAFGYRGSILDEEFFSNMIGNAGFNIETFSDDFFRLSKAEMTLDDFFELYE